MPIVAIKHDVDPRVEIAQRVASVIDDVEVFNNQVLVAVYTRSEQKTKSGIILHHQTTDEDRHQSKIGLILKAGPAAFKDPNGVWFENANLGIGDWVVFRNSDGWSVTLATDPSATSSQRGVLCKLLDDTAIRGRVRSPDLVY
jgi:co-chaperonin GroES (HSP10)